MSAEHCRGPNHSLSLRRQEHFGLHESQVYEKKKKKSYTSKETLYQSWSVTLIPCQMKNSLQSGKTTKYFLCKSFLWFKEKKKYITIPILVFTWKHLIHRVKNRKGTFE